MKSLNATLKTAKERVKEWWWVRSNAARVWIATVPARMWPPRYRPMLDFMLDVGFLSIRTVAMRRSDYAMVYDYIGVEFNVLKWGFRCRLYDTMQRRVDR